MKEFSLIANDGNEYPDMPTGLVLVFGIQRQAIAFTDYDGNADRSQPQNVDGEWFPLARDFDSLMAWHGQRKSGKVSGCGLGKINWKKDWRK